MWLEEVAAMIVLLTVQQDIVLIVREVPVMVPHLGLLYSYRANKIPMAVSHREVLT